MPAWRLRLRTTDLAPELLVPPEVVVAIAKPAEERTIEEIKRVDDFRLTHQPGHFSLTQMRT